MTDGTHDPLQRPEDRDADADMPDVEGDTLWDRLAPRLVRPDRPGLCLSPETAAMLQEACPPLPPSRGAARANDLMERAIADLEFEAELVARRRRPSLGAYLCFLRARAGLTVAEASKRHAFNFQLLTDLERDALRPQQIPARKVVLLIRRWKGSLEQTERLLAATVRAPRFLVTPPHATLFRGMPGGRRVDHPDATSTENPAYRDEVAAAQALVQAAREAWRG